MQDLIDLLHCLDCSCVLRNGNIHTYAQRGVADLYELLLRHPQLLRGAEIADKVVGKGAAALMVLGGVREVYADVLSEPACGMLRGAGVPVSCALLVPAIRNRAGDGWCPVETLCRDKATAEECLPLIREFMERRSSSLPHPLPPPLPDYKSGTGKKRGARA